MAAPRREFHTRTVIVYAANCAGSVSPPASRGVRFGSGAASAGKRLSPTLLCVRTCLSACGRLWGLTFNENTRGYVGFVWQGADSQ